jgi:uncharacterized iron-regulated membrane protein
MSYVGQSNTLNCRLPTGLRMGVIVFLVWAGLLVLFIILVLLIELVIWIKRRSDLNERLVEAPYRHHCQSPKPTLRSVNIV